MILDRILLILNRYHSIFNVIESIQEGSIILPAGTHAVEIKTRKEPVDVVISLADNDGMSVCNGDIDRIGYSILTDGFVLYADVVSDTLQVKWHALFKIEDCKE